MNDMVRPDILSTQIVTGKWLVVARAMIVAGMGSLALVLDIDNTEWSPNFTEEAFAKVSIGMSRAEVSRILGTPLSEDCNSRVGETWQYDLKGQPAAMPEPRFAKYLTVEFDGSDLVSKLYDSNGRVSKPFSDLWGVPTLDLPTVPTGSTKSAVLRALGRPTEVTGPIGCVLSFTRQRHGGWGVVRHRQVLLDPSGQLTKIMSINSRD